MELSAALTTFAPLGDNPKEELMNATPYPDTLFDDTLFEEAEPDRCPHPAVEAYAAWYNPQAWRCVECGEWPPDLDADLYCPRCGIGSKGLCEDCLAEEWEDWND